MRACRCAVFFLFLFITACGGLNPPKYFDQVVTHATNVFEPTSKGTTPTTVTATALNKSTLTPTISLESTSTEIVSIRMFDGNNGWGLTERQVVRTTDAGTTWVDISPEIPDLGASIGTPYFFNKEIAWMLVPDQDEYFAHGTLYSTVDGGLNWTTVTTPFGGGSLTFLDEKNGWMMADLGAGAGSQAVAIYQTSDGGRSWKLKSTNDPTRQGADTTLPLGGLKYELVPLDMNTAFIGGVVYAPGTVYLFRSDDGVLTWKKLTPVLPNGMEEAGVTFKSLQFFGKTNGFLALNLSSSDQKLILYKTQDGGDHWTPLPDEFSPGGKVEFLSASEGVIYNDSSFWFTQDAGQTWSMVQPEKDFGESLTYVDFIDKDLGWVIAYDDSNTHILFRTTDGGRSWVPTVK